jgi:amino acid adenylation domain-containing protein
MDTTIAKLLSNQAKLNPDKIAIKHNGRSITYYDIEVSSNQVASYFIANHIEGDDIVAVAMDRSIKMIVCLWGIIKAGAAYLPIDPNLPSERVDYILKNSGAKILCTTIAHAPKYQDFTDQHLFDDIWITRHNYAPETPEIEHNPQHLAYILYTSGSTGQPKGVAVERNSLVNLLLSIQQSPGITPDDIMLSITTISFDIAELELLLPLISGAQLIIVDNEVVKDGRALLGIIKQEKISILQATPFTWRMLLQSGWDERLPLKAFCGGEALPKDLAQKLLERCSELWNMYGPTETTIYSTIKKISAQDELITIGHPIANTHVYVLDNDHKRLPDGIEGEIYIGGAGVARGYIGREDLTSERFIDDKLSGKKGRLYKTGDWGKILFDGEIQYLGRIDHQIKIRGNRVEAEEVENALKQLKDIKEAVVILHEDSLGNKQLLAYVVVKDFFSIRSHDKRSATWKNLLRNILPDYMIPAVFMVIPNIPLMPNGKLDRKKLPLPSLKSLSQPAKKIKNTTQGIITQIIVKNTNFQKIGLDDNFIDMGIDSMRALMIIVDIEEQFDRRYPLTILIHHPTINLLTRFIDSSTSSSHSSLIALKKDGAKIPLYILHGIGLNLFNFNGMLSHMDPEQPVYGLRAAGLDGDQTPLKSIETLAAHYNQQIFSHDPIGPYAIAGYSFGGIIAFEMVKQLKDSGKKVEMLAMIDTHLQKADPEHFIHKVAKKIIRQFHKLTFRIRSFIQHPWANIDYLAMLYVHKLKSLLVWAGVFDRYKVSELPQYMQTVVDRLENAWGKYKIKPFDVKVDLFRAEKRLYYVDDPEMLGWGEYASLGVNIHTVPGDHENMFETPNDRILAELMQKRLNEMPSNAQSIIAGRKSA